MNALKQLASNVEFLKIMVGHFLVIGSFTALAGVLSFLLSPFGMDSTDTAIVIIMAPPGGIIGSAVSGFLLHKYRKFKFFISLDIIVGITSLAYILILID